MWHRKLKERSHFKTSGVIAIRTALLGRMSMIYCSVILLLLVALTTLTLAKPVIKQHTSEVQSNTGRCVCMWLEMTEEGIPWLSCSPGQPILSWLFATWTAYTSIVRATHLHGPFVFSHMYFQGSLCFPCVHLITVAIVAGDLIHHSFLPSIWESWLDLH